MPVGAESCVAHAACAISLAALAVLSAHTDVALLRQTICEIVIVGQASLGKHLHLIPAASVDAAQALCGQDTPVARLWGWFNHRSRSVVVTVAAVNGRADAHKRNETSNPLFLRLLLRPSRRRNSS